MPTELSTSRAIFDRARRVTPAGVHSNARARDPHPRYFARAEGAYLWDADGRRVLDLVMGNGAVVLGHGHSAVTESVQRAVARGLTCGVEWERAVEAAEAFLRCVPGMDLVRFANTGTEAVTHALHVARHATGRRRLAKVEGSYHGWTDELYVSAFPDPDEAGDPKAPRPVPGGPGLDPRVVADVLVLPFNDEEGTRALLEAHAHELAAVVLEPVLIDAGFIPATPGYLRLLRELTRKHGIVLIFDEILTGFRLAPGGAAERYGVTPDLATYGKAMANGYPIAALAGREELMRSTEPGRGPAYVGTFNGHAVSLAAAVATLPLLADGSVQKELARRTERLRRSFAALAREAGVPAVLAGDGGHFQWYFVEGPVADYRQAARSDPERCRRFTASLEAADMLVARNPIAHHALSLAHGEAELAAIEEAFREALRRARG